jgi:hypothetical protein
MLLLPWRSEEHVPSPAPNVGATRVIHLSAIAKSIAVLIYPPRLFVIESD